MLSRLNSLQKERRAFLHKHGWDIIRMRHELIIMGLGWACLSLMLSQADMVAPIILLLKASCLGVSLWVLVRLLRDTFLLSLDSFEPDM